MESIGTHGYIFVPFGFGHFRRAFDNLEHCPNQTRLNSGDFSSPDTIDMQVSRAGLQKTRRIIAHLWPGNEVTPSVFTNDPALFEIFATSRNPLWGKHIKIAIFRRNDTVSNKFVLILPSQLITPIPQVTNAQEVGAIFQWETTPFPEKSIRINLKQGKPPVLHEAEDEDLLEVVGNGN